MKIVRAVLWVPTEASMSFKENSPIWRVSRCKGGSVTVYVWECIQQSYLIYAVIGFVSISAKLGIYNVMGLKSTLVEAKIRTWDTWKCIIFHQKVTRDGANAKFSTYLEETDYSVIQ